MGEYFRYLKSDFYKLRHSIFFWLHLIITFLGACMMLIYSKVANSNEINKLAAFCQIIAIAFPFVIAIVCQTVAEQELCAGNLQNMLTLPCRRRAILSKFTILIISGLSSVVLCTELFGILFSFMLGFKIPLRFFIIIPLVLWGSNIILYGVHLIIAFQFGRNVGIGMGVVGSMLTALLQTGLGTGIWYIIPYGLGIRFAENVMERVFYLSFITNSELYIGINFCIVATCVIIGTMIFWFTRYSRVYTE